jgi:hypothetical protein
MSNVPRERVSLEALLFGSVVSEQYQDTSHIELLRKEFSEYDIVKLPNLFPEEILSALREEVQNLSYAQRTRDFIMSEYNTLRKLSVIGGRSISRYAGLLPSLYVHYRIKALLSDLIGLDVIPIRHPEECIVVNMLNGCGQTHGWHLDDPAFALIVVLETPHTNGGGTVEYIQRWRDLTRDLECDDTDCGGIAYHHALNNGLIKAITLQPGDCYLLNASETLHRVSPIVDQNSVRIAINMAFDHRRDVTYGSTADQLYSDDVAASTNRNDNDAVPA